MNYQQLYNRLILFRQKNPATGYTEKHHIVMKSMGGSDDPSNLVVLTGREHWIAHLLLYKIHKNDKSLFACHMMAMKCEERGISYIKNSRLYEEVRKHHAKMISDQMKVQQKGESNSQYGTCWICNIELQENKKIKREDAVPDGWVRGRNIWIKTQKKKLEKESERHQKTKSIQEQEEKYYNNLFEIFLSSDYKSVREFAASDQYKYSAVYLIKKWRTYVKAYYMNSKEGKVFKSAVNFNLSAH
jgi:hypothetical protein